MEIKRGRNKFYRIHSSVRDPVKYSKISCKKSRKISYNQSKYKQCQKNLVTQFLIYFLACSKEIRNIRNRKVFRIRRKRKTFTVKKLC